MSQTLPDKESVSAKEWGKLNWFNYDKVKKEWFPTSTWNRRFPHSENVKIDTPMRTYQELPSFPDVVRMVTDIGADVVFMVLLSIAVLYGYRQQKRTWEARVEHTQLLKDILAALKQK